MKQAITKAHVLYWDSEHRTIQSCTIYAETVYPLSITKAIVAFRPEFSKGCNVTFEYVTGRFSVTNVWEF